MKKFILIWLITTLYAGEAIIVDHKCTDITLIPDSAIISAREQLHIAYGHTSHGKQLTEGMKSLVEFANNGGLGLDLYENIFKWSNGGLNGELDLHDYMAGLLDCGTYPRWEDSTRSYLEDPENSDVNVVMWCWCGQVDDKYKAGTLWDEYLGPMDQLEQDYPHIKFIYMTGHVDIEDDVSNKLANDSIRSFCQNNGKILYDFADIERWDPDGYYYEYVHDNCDYYNSNFEKLGNWATEWQETHTEGLDWFQCESPHSEALNANQKAYAAWWLLAQLSGWVPPADIVLEEEPLFVTIFSLDQNYPNPFNFQTIIQYQLFRKRDVSVKIFDIRGCELFRKVNHDQFPGEYSVTWNGENLGSGIYFYRIETTNFSETKKMVLLK